MGRRAMKYDYDKVDEIVLALLYLTITEQNEWGARVPGSLTIGTPWTGFTRNGTSPTHEAGQSRWS